LVRAISAEEFEPWLRRFVEAAGGKWPETPVADETSETGDEYLHRSEWLRVVKIDLD
jgi:hypothetical protein